MGDREKNERGFNSSGACNLVRNQPGGQGLQQNLIRTVGLRGMSNLCLGESLREEPRMC